LRQAHSENGADVLPVVADEQGEARRCQEQGEESIAPSRERTA
jgi:hypothetical protein